MNVITLQFKKYTKLSLFIGALLLSVSILPTSVSADALQVSCNASPTTPYVSDNVNYYASATGGNGSYTYTWSGTDNAMGIGSTMTRAYYAPGQQSATVTVTSNGITQSATCYVNVVPRNSTNYWNNSNYGRLGATCLAIPTNVNIGDNVNWMVQNLTGGNGSYTYSWNGTDGLIGSGQTAYKTYTYTGTKNASVNISSGDGQYITVNCSPVNVGGTSSWNNNNGSLSASCYGTPSQANMYDSVTWFANVTGGNGYYTYTWNGTDGLYGSGQNISKLYSSVGYKTASVTVTSNGQTVTNSCSINIGSTYSYTNPTYYPPYPQSTLVQTPVTTYSSYGNSNPVSGVFLSQLPATGINFSLKMILFTLGISLWSLFAAYLFVQKKNRKVATAGLNQAERIEAFKKANQLKKIGK